MPDRQHWWHKDPYRCADSSKPQVSYTRLACVAILILGCLCLVVAASLDVRWATSVGVPVKREYSNYIDSTPHVYDPSTTIEILQKALQGIESLGLEPTDSGAIFSWFVNYKNSIQYNIDQINSVIDYANNVIAWRDQSYYNNTFIENVNDVYSEKLGHLNSIADNPDKGNIRIAYAFSIGYNLYPYVAFIYLLGFIILVLGVMQTSHKWSRT